MQKEALAVEKKTTKLTQKQIQIYNGLKSIGEEIAAFYIDGVRMFNSNGWNTKSYLLGHIAREIDGGIRGVFALKDEKNKIRSFF